MVTLQKEITNSELDYRLLELVSLMGKAEELIIQEEESLELSKAALDRLKAKKTLILLAKENKLTVREIDSKTEDDNDVFNAKIAVINQTTEYKKKRVEFNMLDREFTALRKISNLRAAMIRAGIWHDSLPDNLYQQKPCGGAYTKNDDKIDDSGTNSFPDDLIFN